MNELMITHYWNLNQSLNLPGKGSTGFHIGRLKGNGDTQMGIGDVVVRFVVVVFLLLFQSNSRNHDRNRTIRYYYSCTEIHQIQRRIGWCGRRPPQSTRGTKEFLGTCRQGL